MPNARMIKSVISEYGLGWLMNRTLYSAKLKMMNLVPITEKWFEKKTTYPERSDIFDFDVTILKSFIKEKLNDDDKKTLIGNADNTITGNIFAFSSLNLNYGDPIDWQLNPLTDKRCDEKRKWFRIPDFDKSRGDIKVIWEASRFSHFITLARAFLLTGDNKYYKAFSNQLKSWLVKNPYGYGANYKCSQECSFRMVNALLAFTVFRREGVATDADASNIKDLIDRCYRKILSNFFYSYKCIKNNHTISEIMGMIVGAWCIKDQKQLDKAYKMLDEVIDEQFTVDGGYRQFSFNYQRLAMQDLEVVMSLNTGRKISNCSLDKIKKSAWLMFQCQDESGDMPNYGSNDGSLVFPVTSCEYRDFRPVINTSYALITGNQIYNEGKHQEELIWFSGCRRIEDYKTEQLSRESSQFSEAGLFTIRSNHCWLMLVSNEYKSRPAHMDQNHIDLWVNGINVLCDAGTFSYADEDGRKLVRNECHNTALVDNKPQMNTSGPFMIYDWTKRQLGNCNSNSFEAKCKSLNGYEHARRIMRTDSSWEIFDTVDRDFSVQFHTPCEIEICDDVARLQYNGNEICQITSSGSMSIRDSTRSLLYLKKERISCLSISGHARDEIITTIKLKERKTND